MANADFNDDPNQRKQDSPAKRKNFGGPGIGFNENTANWGGLPGKPSKPRNAGTPKIKQHPASKGL